MQSKDVVIGLQWKVPRNCEKKNWRIFNLSFFVEEKGMGISKFNINWETQIFLYE